MGNLRCSRNEGIKKYNFIRDKLEVIRTIFFNYIRLINGKSIESRQLRTGKKKEKQIDYTEINLKKTKIKKKI